MKNKTTYIFLIVLVVIIVIVVAKDFISTIPDKRSDNPYEYNVDKYKQVDPKLILYKEVKNLKLGLDNLEGIFYSENKLFIVGDSLLQIISIQGELLKEVSLSISPTSITINSGFIFISSAKNVMIYDMEGQLVTEIDDFGESTVITSIGVLGHDVFIADAGVRKVYHYNLEGKILGDFEGKHEEEALHGFIVPSANFDLGFTPDGELWVANPGNHSLENYSFDGSLRGFWKKSSLKIEGFCGCCNPARFTFLPNGNFVTSEKGLVRIKVYKPSGELVGVVAPPNKFVEDGKAPDITTDESGNIYALDRDKKMVRVFELKN